MKKLLAGFAAIMTISAAAYATPFPGPDGGGYSGNTIAYNFIDISSTGTVVLPNTDDSSTGPVNPLGFSFNFYGNTFSTVNIATNGFLSFGNSNADCCSGTQLGVGVGVPNLIAAFHMDWMTTQSGASIFYQTLGSSGSHEFVVQWNSVNEFVNDNRATFEAILHEGTNDIEFQYLDASSFNHEATVGIQNADMTAGLDYFQAATNQHLVQTGLCISTGSTTCPAAPNNVPEPGTILLVGMGVMGLGFARRRKQA